MNIGKNNINEIQLDISGLTKQEIEELKIRTLAFVYELKEKIIKRRVKSKSEFYEKLKITENI